MANIEKPNILFIMTDQQRWDALGCVGGWVETPNLDRIAAEGTLFTNCVTNSPVCIPARISLATGRYPHNTGVWDNGYHDLPPDTFTWMRAIRDSGYRTSLFGKTHLHHHSGDLREREWLLRAYGLDDVDEIGGPRASARVLSHMTARWLDLGLWEKYRADYRDRCRQKSLVVRPSALPLEEYADTYVGRRASEYLEAYQRPEPWFCWVSFGGPHEPWDAPEPYASMHNPEDMPPPAPTPSFHQDRPRGLLDDRLPAETRFSAEKTAAMRANYAGNVSLIDDQIGAILEVVERRGEMGETVVAFSSDHGELNGDHGLIHKQTFLDGCARVPLIVRTPATAAEKRPAPRICSSPAEWMDVGATLAECAGAELKHRQFAKSLLPSVAEPSVLHRSEAVCEFSGEIMHFDEEWKGAVNREGRIYLLFNRRDDPMEQNNLAGTPEHAAVEDRLRKRLFERVVAASSDELSDIRLRREANLAH